MKRKRAINLHGGLFFIVLILLFSFTSRKKNTERLILNISHLVGDLPLVLDSGSYKNSLGQDFSVTKFKYYVGGITLKQDKGRPFHSDTYFLVNEEEESSKKLILENVPSGNYTLLEFIIGVDSMDNCSGAQSGALDPANAMFWAWNTGYIFLKLEGKAPQSKSPGHFFEYHIGGYKQPANCIRKVIIDLKGSTIEKPGAIKTIFLKANLLNILNGSSSVDFSTLSSVSDFHHAPEIADNYKNMFSLLKKEYED